MDDIILSYVENVGDEIVLHSWVDLNDVAALSSDVEIVDGETLEVSRSGTDCEGMGPGV